MAEVVDHYILHKRQRACDELRWFADQPSLEAVIRKAATATGEHGKLRHQWRIQNSVLNEFANRVLRRISDIRTARTFDVLYGIVDDSGIKGIRALTIYDTAIRIGAFVKLQPERVYLHAGTKEGAKALGFYRRETLAVSELPKTFSRLTSAEIEDCLCIYKDVIARIAVEQSR